MDNAYKTSCIVTQSPTPENMSADNKKSPLMKMIQTPYKVDAFINRVGERSKPNSNKDSIAENVRLVIQQDLAFEDEAVGMTKHMISADEMADMDEEVKNHIMMGIDRDAEEEEKAQLKSMTEKQKDERRELQE